MCLPRRRTTVFQDIGISNLMPFAKFGLLCLPLWIHPPFLCCRRQSKTCRMNQESIDLLDEILKLGWIEPADDGAKWASPAFPVPKKTKDTASCRISA